VFRANIVITLRPSILDPQGKAVRHALESLNMGTIRDVRIGKFIELTIDAKAEQDARKLTEQACKELLGNPVMEDYSYTIAPVGEQEDGPR
jgi:phosphoribosylformylglycinamidine synthase PurS subunit